MVGSEGARIGKCRCFNGQAIHPTSIYDHVVKRYAVEAGIDAANVSPHSLQATAATSAIEGGA